MRTFVVMTLACLAVLAWASSARSQQLPGGYTCEQVRKMSEAKRRWLIWWHGLTDADVAQIKRRCNIR